LASINHGKAGLAVVGRGSALDNHGEAGLVVAGQGLCLPWLSKALSDLARLGIAQLRQGPTSLVADEATVAIHGKAWPSPVADGGEPC